MSSLKDNQIIQAVLIDKLPDIFSDLKSILLQLRLSYEVSLKDSGLGVTARREHLVNCISCMASSINDLVVIYGQLLSKYGLDLKDVGVDVGSLIRHIRMDNDAN